MNQLSTINPDKALTLVIKSINQDPNLADSTKDKYIRTLENYSKTGKSLLSDDDLREYCISASGSTKSFLKAGIRKLALEIEHQAKSNATPENIDKTTAVIYRCQALMDSIKLDSQKGESVHTWLSPAQLKKLISLTRKNGNSLIEIRDRIILGLLSNGMLRRSEVTGLRFNDLQERENHFILEITGKGNKKRGVKLSPQLATDILTMQERIGDGFIIRAMLKRKNKPKGYILVDGIWIGKNISSQALYNLVRKYGAMVKKDIQPHDLRRTGARIAWKAKIPIEQISLTLGHESIETTVLYLGIVRDWDIQPGDVIPY